MTVARSLTPASPAPAPARGGAGRRWGAASAAALFAALVLLAAAPGRASRDAPPLGFSGGFGEPDCTACHFEAEANQAPGSLSVIGVPPRYQPGRTYQVLLTLTRPGAVIAGFELTARFEDGGGQAGRLSHLPADEGRIAVGTSFDVEYIHHLRPGTTIMARDTARWSVLWTAPSEGTGAVLVHAAANAANDDDSQFGDYIYTTAGRSDPERP